MSYLVEPFEALFPDRFQGYAGQASVGLLVRLEVPWLLWGEGEERVLQSVDALLLQRGYDEHLIERVQRVELLGQSRQILQFNRTNTVKHL